MTDLNMIAKLWPLATETGTSPSADRPLLSSASGECFELRFDRPPENRHGFCFGTNKKADIVLRGSTASGQSARQAVITFDQHGHLILQDIRSPHRKGRGTWVSYNGQAASQERRGFTWLLGGTEFLDDGVKTVISFSDQDTFRVLANHDAFSEPSYKEKIQELRKKHRGGSDLSLLSIQPDLITPAPKSVQTWIQAPIYIDTQLLGEGAFGEVFECWDVSTGIKYAKKRLKRFSGNLSSLQREILLLKRAFHSHIVRLISYGTQPSHYLVMEYVPGGTLAKQQAELPFSTRESFAELSQSLSALAYLHGLRPAIVHRDIKPENILIQRRDQSGLHIKLADFGLSKAGHDLTTQCGTPGYAAPEININAPERHTSYTKAVDIWSLAVVILELVRGLPTRERGVRWHESIVRELDKEHPDEEVNDLCDFLKNHMLRIDQRQRSSAKQCLAALRGIQRNHTTAATDGRGDGPPREVSRIASGAAGPLEAREVGGNCSQQSNEPGTFVVNATVPDLLPSGGRGSTNVVPQKRARTSSPPSPSQSLKRRALASNVAGCPRR